MSKELIAKLKETIKQQKYKIEDLKSDIIYYREKFLSSNSEIFLFKKMFNIEEKYYEISFSGLSSTNLTRRIEEVKMIKGYSKTHAISLHVSNYGPSQDIMVSSIKCLSDD